MSTYYDSGEFTPIRKFIYALKINLIYLSISAGVGIIYIICYAIFAPRFDFFQLFALLMSISNAVTLTEIIMFLGNGLIAVPRSLFRKGDLYRKLRMLCCSLLQATEVIESNAYSINTYIAKARDIDADCTEELRGYIAEIREKVPEGMAASVYSEPSVIGNAKQKENNPTYMDVVDLNYRLTTSLHEHAVYSQ